MASLPPGLRPRHFLATRLALFAVAIFAADLHMPINAMEARGFHLLARFVKHPWALAVILIRSPLARRR